MLPIIACSVVAAAIILERLWTLQPSRVLPKSLTAEVWKWVKNDEFDPRHIQSLHQNSPLGQLLAAGLINRHSSREIVKESIEDTGRHVVHELERYLNPLGTIAAVSPLLGLLGTVIGMVKVFAAIMASGVDDRCGLDRRDSFLDRLQISPQPDRRACRADGEGGDEIRRSLDAAPGRGNRQA
jgi:biopolymer transport protein ExbB